MSRASISRRSVAEVSVEGVDISKPIRSCLIELSYTDNEGSEADDLQITLEDRDGFWMEKWLNDAVQAAATKETIQAEAVKVEGKTYVTTAKSGLRVRKGRGTNTKKLGLLPLGTEVVVGEIVNGWASFQYGGIVRGNSCAGGHYGIILRQGLDVIVSDNICKGNKKAGILIEGAGFGHVSGNTIHDFGYETYGSYGIELSLCSDIEVIGNTTESNYPEHTCNMAGIYVGQACKRCIVAQNIVKLYNSSESYGANDYSILLDGGSDDPTDCIVVHNIVKGKGVEERFIDASTNTIENNKV